MQQESAEFYLWWSKQKWCKHVTHRNTPAFCFCGFGRLICKQHLIFLSHCYIVRRNSVVLPSQQNFKQTKREYQERQSDIEIYQLLPQILFKYTMHF